jgi:hypothetical protein
MEIAALSVGSGLAEQASFRYSLKYHLLLHELGWHSISLRSCDGVMSAEQHLGPA